MDRRAGMGMGCSSWVGLVRAGRQATVGSSLHSMAHGTPGLTPQPPVINCRAGGVDIARLELQRKLRPSHDVIPDACSIVLCEIGCLEAQGALQV